ncbi:MAG: Gp138 family membrane-puncturing spike protein [Desulfobacterales bacterium]|nr:Gp138 family membrane-puncturing spike protein [Desulfobacterales bacterium]
MERKQLTDTINAALHFTLANLHTATIARVVKVREKTIDVQPVINREVDGESIKLPLFVKVPPVFMQGGSSYSAHPIAAGDYCLLVFTERCFDRWYSGQDERSPAEYRMHDYSDGFAIVGLNPQAVAKTIPTVITHIGDTYAAGDYEQIGNYTHTGNRVQTGNHTQTGDFTLTGNMLVDGNITCTGTIAAANFTGLSGTPLSSSVNIETSADVKAGTISLKSHVHPENDSGGPTGTPI